MVCENCGCGHTSSRFCSVKCSRSFSTKFSKNKTKFIKCVQCFKEIEVKLRSSSNILCKECKLVEKSCEYCGNLFKTKNDSKTCSIECKQDRVANINRNRRINSSSDLKNYSISCKFKFNVYHFPDKYDLSLVEKYGWYKAKNRGDNPNGVSRDHIMSVKHGFENNILPWIISHPANCELMQQRKNASKYSKCDITLDELMLKIENW